MLIFGNYRSQYNQFKAKFIIPIVNRQGIRMNFNIISYNDNSYFLSFRFISWLRFFNLITRWYKADVTHSNFSSCQLPSESQTKRREKMHFEELLAQCTVIQTHNPVIYDRLVVIELEHWSYMLIFPFWNCFYFLYIGSIHFIWSASYIISICKILSKQNITWKKRKKCGIEQRKFVLID